MFSRGKEGDPQVVPPTTPATLDDIARYRPFDLLLRDVRFIKARYGMSVKLGSRDRHDITGIAVERLDPVSAAESLILLREELAKYPYTYIRYCRVSRVRFASSLKMQMGRNGKADQMRAYGGLAFSEGPIYLLHKYYGIHEIPHTRASIHHELWHRSDQNAIRHLEVLGLKPIMWLLWNRNNPPGAYLGDKIWDLIDEERRGLDFRGFATPYGRANYNEDRATVAEGLMNDTALYFYRCKDDPVLARKVKLTMLDYRLKSDGLMDRKFFDDLAYSRVGETYWDNKLAQRPEIQPPLFTRPSVLAAACIIFCAGLILRRMVRDKT